MICTARARSGRRRLAQPLARQRFCTRKHLLAGGQPWARWALRLSAMPETVLSRAYAGRNRIGPEPRMIILAFWHSGEVMKNHNGLPDAVRGVGLGRKIALAWLENGEGHETAAITPPP